MVALNYFNSVCQGNATAMVKTDLMRVHFGDDDRLNITCYVDGCTPDSGNYGGAEIKVLTGIASLVLSGVLAPPAGADPPLNLFRSLRQDQHPS